MNPDWSSAVPRVPEAISAKARPKKKVALRTCEDRCEYCKWRPCVEAFDHGERTNYAMPHRCVLRQKGQDCEAIEDSAAAASSSTALAPEMSFPVGVSVPTDDGADFRKALAANFPEPAGA